MGLVARGSRRVDRRASARCCSRSCRCKLSWVRRGELGRLTHVEADGAEHRASTASGCSRAITSNELLLRLLARGDPNGEVFSCYSRCLAQLGRRVEPARTLRVFELELLRALGYGIELDGEATTGEPLRAELALCLRARARVSPRRAARTPTTDVYSGRDLLALARSHARRRR